MSGRDYENVFEAISDDPMEVFDLTLRSDLLDTILGILDLRGWTNAETGAALRIPAPRVSELMRGKIQLLTVPKLIGYLGLLGYQLRPSLDKGQSVACRVEEIGKAA
nr:XRE family transcriptional regulator [uncultured Gellertiella sp.]